jgi:hypothetical protein
MDGVECVHTEKMTRRVQVFAYGGCYDKATRPANATVQAPVSFREFVSLVDDVFQVLIT